MWWVGLASFSLSSLVKTRAVCEGAKDITKQEELFGEFSLSTEATVVVTELLNARGRVVGACGYAAVNDCGELKVLSPTPPLPFPRNVQTRRGLSQSARYRPLQFLGRAPYTASSRHCTQSALLT